MDGNEVVRHSSDEEPFSALAFKIMTDPFVGKLAFFRVYSGTLNSGSYTLNATKGKNCLLYTSTTALTDGQCDGALYHMNRSCKLMSFIQYEMARIAADETGLPYTGFDGDQADPRGFAQAQFDTRLQGLVEIMEERKEVKEG